MEKPSEIPQYCNYYEILVATETITLRFYYKDHLTNSLSLLSSLVFDKTLCQVFLLTALGKLKEGGSPPTRL